MFLLWLLTLPVTIKMNHHRAPQFLDSVSCTEFARPCILEATLTGGFGSVRHAAFPSLLSPFLPTQRWYPIQVLLCLSPASII